MMKNILEIIDKRKFSGTVTANATLFSNSLRCSISDAPGWNGLNPCTAKFQKIASEITQAITPVNKKAKNLENCNDDHFSKEWGDSLRVYSSTQG